MQTSISQFMKIALSVIVIAGLLFYVGYKMVEDEVTGTGGYQQTITNINAPNTSGPAGSR